ncbi:hypothetical protein C8R43DRAFT_1111808 [Mycena crocata]|nr:hypothetical protein C8R43DRAFT_1111808 [Mycena crocata]
MFFTTALLFAALVPSALSVPSHASAEASTAVTNAQIIARVQNVVAKYHSVNATLHTIELKSPTNAQTAAKISAAKHTLSLLKGNLVPRVPLSGTIGTLLSGSERCFAGLLPKDPLGKVVGGGTGVLLTGLLDQKSSVNGLLTNILTPLGGLGLGGRLGPDLSLNSIVASLLGSVSGLNAGCKCGVDPATAFVTSLQQLLAELLALVDVVQTCGCGSNPALLSSVTKILRGF